jgi:hypothetical protein
MRIGGEDPGRRAHSRNRCQHYGLLRVTASSDRHRIPTMFCSSGSESLSCPSSPLTPSAIRRQPEARQWSPSATGQLATCTPAPRSLSCAFCQRSQFVSDTTGSMHCLSGRAKNAKPTGSSRGVLVRCPPWRVLSLAACCRDTLCTSEDPSPLRADALARPLRCTRRVPPCRHRAEPQNRCEPFLAATINDAAAYLA